MTFEQIERVTGAKLPPRAQHHRAWWSNNPSNNVMTKVWLAAGYQSARVDLAARRLVFRRIDQLGSGVAAPASHSTHEHAHFRHPLRGLLKEVTCIPPGVDLTEPADPEWADLLDKKFGPEARRTD